jgi:hypothetical protein
MGHPDYRGAKGPARRICRGVFERCRAGSRCRHPQSQRAGADHDSNRRQKDKPLAPADRRALGRAIQVSKMARRRSARSLADTRSTRTSLIDCGRTRPRSPPRSAASSPPHPWQGRQQPRSAHPVAEGGAPQLRRPIRSSAFGAHPNGKREGRHSPAAGRCFFRPTCSVHMTIGDGR